MTITLKDKLLYLFTFIFSLSFAQTTIWVEDFDDGGGGRWTLENAPGSLNNPTPTGIPGLTYGTNDPVHHDNWVINDRNTPELNGNIAIGTPISNQGQLVQGHHYDCVAPNNLPNPFINNGAVGPNQSLHITAYPTCATLLYGGTPQSDDWNCISDPDNGDIQTQTEQIAYLNNNIDATGKCNLVLTADFFLGGDSDGIKSHGTILYSIDAGLTWKIVQDSLRSCDPYLAGTCNNWHRRSFQLPADADNQNDIRIAFRWYDDGDINNTGDYALGASFNVDNIMISACDAPTANFTVDHTNGCKNETFTFTDQSTTSAGFYTNCTNLISNSCDITSWTWNISPTTFNYVNGTSANTQNIAVEFTANGTYSVTLTVATCGGNGVQTQSNIITISDCPPTANFTSSQLSVCAIPSSSQDTVSFTDISTTNSTAITGWNWSFSPATVTFVNGTNANSQNIDVVFDAIGSYQVSLTVTNSEGNDTEIKPTFIEAIDCNCGGGGGGTSAVVWLEDFENSCSAGCIADGVNTGNGPWVLVNNSPAIDACGFPTSPNTFYVSCAENGNAAGACGAGCGNDESLHVGSTTLGDLGAAYDAGGWCAFGLGGWGAGTETDIIAQSPAIDLSASTSHTLDLVYIETGDGTNDDASLWYFDGTTWSLLDPLAKTSICGSGQGMWTALSIVLPASADNNPNVRIGFKWVNNDDGAGSDPSFAVDDIRITGFTGGGSTANTWEGDVSIDWNTPGNWSSNTVPTSTIDALVPATLCPTCVMPEISTTAFAQNVCNFGAITLVTDNTLTIDGFLLNEGSITTTTVLPNNDVIFANTPSIYKGNGTLYDVDVAVTSSDLTLETNMAPRSFSMSTTGIFDLASFILSLNRDFTKTNGTLNALNGEIHFLDACPTCLDQANTSDVFINANQIFGNLLVNKPSGLKTSLMSAFNYTLNTPKTVTIQNGVLDANTFTLNGTGNLTMTGGELQLAKCATTLPELTGTYTLPNGKITFDGLCNQFVKQTSVMGENYFKLEFNGTNIKNLNGTTLVNDSLLFRLPTTLNNYVDAGVDTLYVLNNNVGIVSHTGGHVVGFYNRAVTANGGDYIFHVGSTNADAETYFEPIIYTPNNLIGPSSITAKFLDPTPNPSVVVPNIYFGLPPVQDTISLVEIEGYWHMSNTGAILGGNYTATVSPDLNYWTLAQPWGLGYYTLLKQATEGISWSYTSGGIRVNDSTTQTFNDFSNYALAYTNNPLPNPLGVELLGFNAYCENNTTILTWSTISEINSYKFYIEKSIDGINFHRIGEVQAAGESQSYVSYTFQDTERNTQQVYYRLTEADFDGEEYEYGTILSNCDERTDFEAMLYPNPNNGAFNISLFSSRNNTFDLSIMAISGKKIVIQENKEVLKGNNLIPMNFDLPAGTYFISIRMNNKTKVLKVTIF